MSPPIDDRGVPDVSEPAHAQLGEHQAGFEPAGDVDAGVNDARAGGERGMTAMRSSSARDGISIGERPRPLVHPKLGHIASPHRTHEDHEDLEGQKSGRDCETTRIFISFVFLIFVLFESLVNFVRAFVNSCVK